MQGVITIKLEGATFAETERYRLLINTLFTQGVLNLRNGSAILHFDHEGILQEIEIHTKQWRRNKLTQPLSKGYETAIIELTK